MTITINGTTGITNDGGYTGDGVVFADTTPANTLVTTTGGNVGIGTSSPNNKLAVMSASGAAGITLTTNGNYTNAGYIYNDSTYIMLASSAGSTGYKFRVALTAPDNSATIDSSGNLLVGTTSLGNTHAYFERSSVDRAVLNLGTSSTLSNLSLANFRTPNGIVGSITVSSTSTAYVTSSDYRLKENVQPMTGALSLVQQLKPCTYKWKSDGSDGQGFIAHELQAVVPECVTGEKDAVDAEGKPIYQGIDTSFLVATLTAAIQEQQAIILAQESALNALTARVAALEGK